jgi:hypothetical protein
LSQLHPHILKMYNLRMHFNVNIHLILGLPSGRFQAAFSSKFCIRF